MKKILITLATGRTGLAATRELLAAGESVRIYVRSADEKALGLVRQGAELALGTFDDYKALRSALEGVDRVYYCYPYKRGMPEDIRLFLRAAKETGVQTVVFMGQRIAEYEDTGSRLTDDVRECYKLLAESGLQVVTFAPGYFADNVLVASEMVLQLGIFPNMFGAGRNPWISTGDMGRCLAALLKNPTPYAGRTLFPTGPKSLSSKELVTIFSNVAGHRVRMFPVSEWLFLKSGTLIGREYGFDAFAIVQGTFYNRQMQLNRFDIEPTTVVEELTGRKPEDFETVVREHFATSPYRIRTFQSWLQAFIRFNRMPFVKIPSRRERRQLNEGLA